VTNSSRGHAEWSIVSTRASSGDGTCRKGCGAMVPSRTMTGGLNSRKGSGGHDMVPVAFIGGNDALWTMTGGLTLMKGSVHQGLGGHDVVPVAFLWGCSLGPCLGILP
jgi:hypothetical protein